MIKLSETFNKLATDDVLLRHMKSGRVSLPAPASDGQAFSKWFGAALVPVPDDLQDRRMARAFVAYVVDQFWEDHKEKDAAGSLQEIRKAAEVVEAVPHYNLPIAAGEDSLAGTLRASVDMLEFLYNDYAPFLRENFSSCFLVGSMSYGRFFSVRGESVSRPSDLDLFLVSKDGNLDIKQLVPGNALEDTLDSADRLRMFSKKFHAQSEESVNYKLRHKTCGFEVSLTIATEAGLKNILDINNGSGRYTNLNRSISLQGRKNILTDLAGAPFEEDYREDRTENGYILSLPVLTYREPETHQGGRFSGMAAMFLPRMEALFSTESMTTALNSFSDSVKALGESFNKAGNAASVCNVHPRRERFSPLFRDRMNARFRMEVA